MLYALCTKCYRNSYKCLLHVSLKCPQQIDTCFQKVLLYRLISAQFKNILYTVKPSFKSIHAQLKTSLWLYLNWTWSQTCLWLYKLDTTAVCVQMIAYDVLHTLNSKPKYRCSTPRYHALGHDYITLLLNTNDPQKCNCDILLFFFSFHFNVMNLQLSFYSS